MAWLLARGKWSPFLWMDGCSRAVAGLWQGCSKAVAGLSQGCSSRQTAGPLDIVGYPGYEKLSTVERTLCSEVR